MGRNKHIDLFKDMIPAVDLGISELWDASTEDGQKEITGDLWNLNRYISNVKSSNREIQEHYVLTVNEVYNKHWFVLSKHPKLQWMLLCSCGYDKKTPFFHEWIGFIKSNNINNNKFKLLTEIYPNTKLDDLELLATLYTDKELIQLAVDNGFDENTVKKKFK